ncbi:MAG: molybdopterin-dependent oxidoreductase, partial [Gemmatimonadaceae bacterium]
MNQGAVAANRPGILTGAWVGLLLAVALAAVAYLAHHAAALPFPPYDLFDWTSRRLPGGLVTFGIDTMVSIIRALGLGETSTVAKMAEQGMAIAAFLIGGAVAGGFAFVALRNSATPAPRRRLAIVSGLLAAIVFAGIHLGVSREGDAPALIALPWLLVLFTAWGVALGRSYDRLTPTPSAAGATVEQIDRRRFLVRLGGATATITVVGATLGRLLARGSNGVVGGQQPWSATNRLPNADARVQPVRGTRAELTPVRDHYRIDINTRVPRVDVGTWRLRVSGLVSAERQLTLDQLRSYEPMHHFVTLECISNRVAGDLISTTRWTGVSLQRLLADWGVRPEATHLVIRSADGFHEAVALDVIRGDERVMLCYEWDGLPLPREHGAPLRIWIPDRYGMKQPKWIESIEAVGQEHEGYWVTRGWDREARFKSTAVIDNVATDMMMPSASGST